MKQRILSLLLALVLLTGCLGGGFTALAAEGDVNLAPEATVTASYSANWDNLLAVQKTDEPTSSAPVYKDQYSCAWQRGTHWVEYYFSETKSISSARVLWYDDGGGYRCPTSAEIQIWNGTAWVKVGDMDVAKDTYNTATFSTPLSTNRIRVQMTNDNNSMGIKRFQVFGKTAAEQVNDGPVVMAGLGYYAILPNKLLLVSTVADDGLPNADALKITWEQISGPSQVVFQNPDKAVTYATATEAGKYEFRVTATDGQYTHSDTTTVNVYEEGSGYGNPILPGMFPDPHAYYDEENKKFYIFATSMENDNGAYGRASTWVSEDFVNWEMKLNNWPIEGQDGWGSIWAPDIVQNPNNGKYYQFITNSGGYNTWLAVSDSLDGPWENALDGRPLIGDNGSNAVLYGGGFCMDAQPFIDDNGDAYVYWGWGDPRVAKLNDDFTGFESEVIHLKGTKWVADGGTHPQWAIVDLGQEYDITKITTAPEFRHVVYQYKIETSNDKSNWTTFADRTQNTTTVGQGTYVDEGTATARYVKITILGSQGNWASLYEVSVYAGEELVSLNKPVEVSTFRNGDGGEKITDGSSGPALSDFTEGSYMVKHGEKYYLLYSSGTLNDGSYSVHYSVSDSPTGPFYTPENNVILQSNAEQTTRGPGHNSVLKFGDDYYIVYHQHNQPHEEGDGVFRQTAADKLVFNDEEGTIEAVVPTQHGIGALLPYQDPGTDLAQGKYATATSVRDANVAAEYALDHNNASKWKAKTNTYPQSLTVDLEQLSDIERIETSFEFTTLSYKYKIETSVNGEDWETYVDKTDAFEAYDEIVSPHKDVKDARARYVRITITGCERPENDAAIYSFQVFGQVAPQVETHEITVHQTKGGTISPDTCQVEAGKSQTFTITPDAGYEIINVLVDGESVGKRTSYTFEAVNAPHTITALFGEKDEPWQPTHPVTPVEPEMPEPPAPPTGGYYDVAVGSWYYDAVSYVTEEGLMTGVGNGKFNPNGAVTRAMVWTVLARMDGENTEGGSTWYSKAQSWAMETGVSDGTNPMGSITREQLAAMLYRYEGSLAVSGNLSNYPDANTVSDWAKTAMVWATQKGIINGINGYLKPQDGATRAQLAAMLMRR